MFERGKKEADKETQASPVAPRAETVTGSAPQAGRRVSGSRDAAVLGPSIRIDGDVRGDEDLVVEGEVNGTIQLANNCLTVGKEGKVKADVHAHSIYVDGTVDGDLYGTERVSVRSTARVRGNIVSPRVSLDDGARFKGSIEMDPDAVKSTTGRGNARGEAAPKTNGESPFAKPKPAAEPAAKTGQAG